MDDGTGRRVCERLGDVDGVSVGWGGIGMGSKSFRWVGIEVVADE